jgi:uncharacterized membrane protein
MFRNVKRMGRWLAIAVALGLLCVSDARAGKPDKGPSYQIVALDDAGGAHPGVASDINNQRQIVGGVDDPLGGSLAACWTTSQTGGEVQSELHLLAGGAWATGINESGEIVGEGMLGDQHVGLYWPDKNAAAPLVLLPAARDQASSATGINKNGVICGASIRLVPRLDENGDPMFDGEGNQIFDSVGRAVAWRINGADVVGPVELPSPDSASTAAINDNDANGWAEIVGSFTQPWADAVVWQVRSEADGMLTVGPCETLAFQAYANGVNNSGAICGYSFAAEKEAVVWDGDSIQVLDRTPSVWNPHAEDINANGVIVGSGYYQKAFSEGDRAVVWPNASGEMVLLNKFLDRDSSLTSLVVAWAVNEAGEIVGLGWDGSSHRAFLAIPK